MILNVILTKEIIFYSLIPAVVAFLLIMLGYFIWLKKEYRNSLSYNYFIKVMIIILICIVLPLITGYTFWIIELFSKHNVLLERFPYVMIIIFLSLSLLALLIWMYLKMIAFAGLFPEKKEDE